MIEGDIAALRRTLAEALALADQLDLPLVAIHLDEACALLGDAEPVLIAEPRAAAAG